MATLLSNGTGGGNWSSGSSWALGSPPGATDYGSTEVGDTITYNAPSTDCLGWILNGGTLVLSKAFSFSDLPNALATIKAVATGVLTTNGSKTTPRVFESENTPPTNKWGMAYEDIVGADARSLDFSYCEFIGNTYFIGNDDASIANLNLGGSTDPLVVRTIPLRHDILLDEHGIDGRTEGGRVYPRAVSARIATVIGVAHVDNFLEDQIKAIIDTKKRIAMFTNRVHVAKCWIARYNLGEERGVYRPFSITVKEDTNI